MKERSFSSPFLLDVGRSRRAVGTAWTDDRAIPAPEDLRLAMVEVDRGTKLAVHLRFERLIDGIFVSGTIASHMVGECSRCLKKLEYDEETEIHQMFFFETTSEDEESLIEGRWIDLEPTVRGALVDDMPFQPLCREDCEGLCSVCGLPLVQSHRHEQRDPRWETLKNFRSDASEK